MNCLFFVVGGFSFGLWIGTLLMQRPFDCLSRFELKEKNDHLKRIRGFLNDWCTECGGGGINGAKRDGCDSCNMAEVSELVGKV
jgi:hypothetical protein